MWVKWGWVLGLALWRARVLLLAAIGVRSRPTGAFGLGAALEGSVGALLGRNASVECPAHLAGAKALAARHDLGCLPVAPLGSGGPRLVARAGWPWAPQHEG